MMRIFIAVQLPQDIRQKIREITAYFQQKTPADALKWVEPDRLHLTVKFVGEIKDDKLKPIEEVLCQSLANQEPFKIEVGGLGMYPHKNNPRVIWLGVQGGDPLVKMHHILDRNLAELEVPREGRPFSPHLTIARVSRQADPSSVKTIGHTLSQFTVDSLGVISVYQVALFQSVLTPSGPIYTSLCSVTLNQV